MFGLSLGEMDMPPQSMPSVILAGWSSRWDRNIRPCMSFLWDFMQLMGQPGADDEPQSFVIFSTKKSESSSGLCLFNNKVQNSDFSANHLYGQENNILEVPNVTSIKKFLLMIFQVNQLLSFISFLLFPVWSLCAPEMCFLSPPSDFLLAQMRCISMPFLLVPVGLSNQYALPMFSGDLGLIFRGI